MDQSRGMTDAPEVAAVGAGGVAVHTPGSAGPPMAVPAIVDPKVTKVIVAVHGVGDQYSFATLQSVVNQFCGFYRQPAALPLGTFHTGKTSFSIHPPYPADPFERLAFSEVYWAKIPRDIVDDKHTLEESKRWAGTIVERLRMRWNATGKKGDCRDADFDMTKLVLGEMIQTLAVLERLCYLADRAGVFTFDLRTLLNDYLGDVQVVAEFGTERKKILATFADVLDAIPATYPNAEIFIVAHSEGTVVSLLGMVEAGLARPTPVWLTRVRGFMTIGSPIDKHLILWPDLFTSDKPQYKPGPNATRIKWLNYYDRGDPIGFSLDDARRWLESTGWDSVFDFTDNDDFGFDRYPFPGKAHVDYWTDPAVFGHFIETVVKEPSELRREDPQTDFTKPPTDIRWKKWLSYLVPYVGVAAILFVGVFILYKSVVAAIDPDDKAVQGTMVILRSVAGTTILLLGVTVTTRILRLANSLLWKILGFLIWAVCAVAFLLILRSGPTVKALGNSWDTVVPIDLIFALGLGLVVWLSTALHPSWGLKPLIALGTTLIAIVVGFHLSTATSAGNVGPIWPVLLATAGFLYLWSLSALTFDLVFVWHLQIRQARALARLDEIIGTPWGGARYTPRTKQRRSQKQRTRNAQAIAESAVEEQIGVSQAPNAAK